MPRSRPHLALSFLLLAVATGGAGQALSVPFRSTFTLDTVDLAPAVGGDGQPSTITVPAGSLITVVEASLGLENQPVQLDSPTGAATWLAWWISPLVSDLGVEARFSISFASAFYGSFFDLQGPGGVKARLHTNDDGELIVLNSCASHVLGSFTPGVPVDVVVRFVPPSSVWLIADGEANGFEDNVPFAFETCNPGSLSGFIAYAWSTNGSPALVAFDDFVVGWLPILVADFEEGDLAEWSSATP